MASACLANRQAISDQRWTLLLIGPVHSGSYVALTLSGGVDPVRHYLMESCHELEKRAERAMICPHYEASICQPLRNC